MVKNVYIHIPFCKSKCKYCSFISYPCTNLKEKFLQALKYEISHFYRGEILNTLYFGGGTPSLLETKDFAGILELFNLNKNTEITTELNPETLSVEYLKNLKNLGVNRISLGCQTFDENILKIIGRRHDAKTVINAVKRAKRVGINNISLDFIYGLPEQSLEIFETDLKKAISLEVEHISLYGLKIDAGCYFYENIPKNLPDDDLQADMYLRAIEILTQNNFEHYEISNFAKTGYNSQHNLNYWNNNTYYGFGTAAHGYVNGIRYVNSENIQEYITQPLKKLSEHKVTKAEQLEESIFLGFRRGEGINTNEINMKFGINFENQFRNILQKYIQSGHLVKTQQGYKFTNEGFMVSNIILADFIG